MRGCVGSVRYFPFCCQEPVGAHKKAIKILSILLYTVRGVASFNFKFPGGSATSARRPPLAPPAARNPVGRQTVRRAEPIMWAWHFWHG